MSILDGLEIWVNCHRAELASAGALKFTRGPEAREKKSAHLTIDGPRDAYELLLWESGEAEFNQLLRGVPSYEHLEFASVNELHRFLLDFSRRFGSDLNVNPVEN